MRFLLGLVAVLFLLFGGYWVAGQQMLNRGAAAGFAQLQAEGLEATHAGISTGGFPARFDTTVTAPRLHDPATGLGWEAPWLRLHALSYMPTEVIALFPDTQVLTLPRERVDIRAEGMRASGRVGFAPSLPLANVTIESGPLTLAGDSGWQAGIAGLVMALRQAASGPADYDLWVEGTDITLTAPGFGGVPQAVQALRVDAAMTLDQPINRALRPDARLTALTLRQAVIDLGATGLSAEGAITLDAAGVPTGTLTLTMRDWRGAVAFAAGAGLVPPQAVRLVETAGALMAGGGADLTAPLVFEEGRMRLGAVPLGPAPALYAAP
jgi:hypothetical protein